MGYPCVGREIEGEWGREREGEGGRRGREHETEGSWRERERERESWDIRGKERDDSEGEREGDIKNVSVRVSSVCVST
jgi:hypothetical protein